MAKLPVISGLWSIRRNGKVMGTIRLLQRQEPNAIQRAYGQSIYEARWSSISSGIILEQFDYLLPLLPHREIGLYCILRDRTRSQEGIARFSYFQDNLLWVGERWFYGEGK